MSTVGEIVCSDVKYHRGDSGRLEQLRQRWDTRQGTRLRPEAGCWSRMESRILKRDCDKTAFAQACQADAAQKSRRGCTRRDSGWLIARYLAGCQVARAPRYRELTKAPFIANSLPPRLRCVIHPK